MQVRQPGQGCLRRGRGGEAGGDQGAHVHDGAADAGASRGHQARRSTRRKLWLACFTLTTIP